MRVPEKAGRGLAEVTIRFDAWKGAEVAPTRCQLDVVAPKIRIRLEEVSSRLKASLVHPNKKAELVGIRFSPDGRRIIASDFKGVIQLWDVESGRQLTKIESSDPVRNALNHVFVSPDWKKVYVAREKRLPRRIERDGRKILRWEFESDIRAWDLATGNLQEVFAQAPMRGIRGIMMSPDGSTFVVGEELPGESEGPPRQAVSLVDAKSETFRQLPGNLAFIGEFSPDSRSVALVEEDGDSYSTAIAFFDVATGQRKKSLPVAEEFSQVGRAQYAPDPNLFVSADNVYRAKNVWKDSSAFVRFWDLPSGAELATFPLAEEGAGFSTMIFSPDGKTLTARTWEENKNQLLLFDVPRRKLSRTILPGENGEKAYMRGLVFSPDGRWIAVATQSLPKEGEDDESGPEDLPQPRIHLVETASGKLVETLVSPQAFPISMGFSPDGKTLASGGYGRVLLWDLEDVPGTR